MVDKNIGNYSSPPPPPVSSARQRSRRRKIRGGSSSGIILLAAALIIVFVLGVTGLSVALFVMASQNETEILPTVVADIPTPVDARVDFNNIPDELAMGSIVTLSDGREIVIEPWDGESRFTILVMGLDRRPGETGLAYRTDTMMILSLDPITNSIGILSIPRDLYVPVPGYTELQRVNSPMVLGELQREGYGPTLAMQTVQNNLGIRVNDYMAVDFNGFIQFIDAIGGIEVTLNYTINDRTYPNMYYGYDPFYLPPGTHQLDGATALKFARTRHGSSDFQRAQRQQMVLYAIRDRILEPGMLAQLIIQAPTLYAQFQDNVATGLTLDQMIQLALYVKDVPTENINTGVIDQRYVMNYSTPQGASVLIPNRATLGPLMVEVFGATYNR